MCLGRVSQDGSVTHDYTDHCQGRTNVVEARLGAAVGSTCLYALKWFHRKCADIEY